MKSDFSRFLKNNRKVIKNFNSKYKVVLIDRGRFNNAIYGIYLAKILNTKFNLDCVILSDKHKNSDIIKFYKSFGFQKFIKIFNYKDVIFTNIIISFLSFFKSIKLFIYSFLKGFEWMINNLKFKKILIGDLIYDTYIRTGHKFLNPSFDLKLFNLFYKTIFRIYKINNILNVKRVKCIIVGTYTYAYNDALSIRIGIKKKIRVIEAAANILHDYNFNVIKNGNDFCLIEKNIGKIKKIAKESTINKFLKERALGKKNLLHTRNIDIKIQNFGEKFTRKKLLTKLKLQDKEIDKIVLFASHKFSESPHAKGKLIFRDYFDQFRKTLEYIEKTNHKRVLWLFKAHPSSGEFNESNIVAKEVKRIRNPNIRMCPKNLNSQQLSKFCDLVITSRGTIGLEFASQGKPVLITGNAAYSKRNITIEPKNKKKYFEILNNLNYIEPLSSKKTLLAKKILYYLENFKLDMNNSDIALTLEEELKAKGNYFKHLNYKLLKKSFFQDTYFKQLKVKINSIF